MHLTMDENTMRAVVSAAGCLSIALVVWAIARVAAAKTPAQPPRRIDRGEEDRMP